MLLSVPNVSEGRVESTILEIGEAFTGSEPSRGSSRAHEAGASRPGQGRVLLLDVHSDGDHHRSVFTLAGRPGQLAEAVLRGARAAVERIDVMARARGAPSEHGQHPHVGALDVAPIVYLDHSSRGAACAEALVLADMIGNRLEVPVFLYGELTAEDGLPGRTRAELRRGGAMALDERMAAETPDGPRARDAGRTQSASGIAPDFGPPRLHATAGATLVAARPPLVAFNLQLAPPAGVRDARAIAALIREGGSEGLPALRAIGVSIAGGVAQVSMNVERPFDLPLAAVVDAVRSHAAVSSAELVGLAPAAALEGFPEDVPMPGFDPARHVIENALGC